ncbi:PAS domain-containing protein [Rufibacter tibetensis]|uniref:histidine kinase n=1 Tax=Rufibacter tibetensis TaxID=512763 RepID=A0A0P0CWG6_9BACT|nr:PAS domain-containing protein [Rufibacter tibetensis]ALI99698.1 hypothetical protein DC20_12840 [Rufibacter tibetensis]
MSQVKEEEITQIEPSVLLQILEAAPDPYLILSPDLKIRAVTQAYLTATLSRSENLIGKNVFEAFPDNPATPEVRTVENLLASLMKVLRTKHPHQMPTQHYDVPKPLELGGGFEEKHWNPVNVPVLNNAGEVIYIIHKVTDVTALVNKQDEVKDLTRERNALQVGLDLAHDIQQKLKEDERRLKEAQAIGHIGSFESVLPGAEVVWSDEMYRIYGLEPQSEPATLERFSSFVHPDDKLRYDQAMQVFFQEQRKLDLTYKIIRADGQLRIVHTLATVTRGAGEQDRVHGTVQDITEQKLAQEKLEANEALLRQAESVGQTGSYEANAATMYFRFSDEAYRILGYEPYVVEPTLEWLNSISFQEDEELVNQRIAQATETNQPYQYIRRIYWPNGQLRYLEGKGRVIYDEQGQPVKYLGTIHDITDQIRTDLILNTINEVCFELDEQLQFRYANRKAYEAWGKNPEEVLGKGYFEVLPENSDSDISEVITTAVQRKEQILQRLYNPIDERWYFYNATPSPTGLIVLYYDITDRVNARRKIQQQQEQFQVLIENMPDLISKWNKDGVLVYNNPNFEAKLGLRTGGELGKTNLEMGIIQEVARPFLESLQKVFASGQPQDHSCDIQTPEG